MRVGTHMSFRPPYFYRTMRPARTKKTRTFRQKSRDAYLEVRGSLLDRIRRITQSGYQNVLEEAFQIATQRRLTGDYVEFGVYTGRSFIQAFHILNHYRAQDQFRMFAFDSFSGIPALATSDEVRYGDFAGGAFACSEDEFVQNIRAFGVPTEVMVAVPGFYEQTCTRETAERIGLAKVSVVMIDCDILSSTLTALRFISPYLEDGAVVIFDDWNHYRSHPQLGERGALSEWLQEQTEFIVTPIRDSALGAGMFSFHRRLSAHEHRAREVSRAPGG